MQTTTLTRCSAVATALVLLMIGTGSAPMPALSAVEGQPAGAVALTLPNKADGRKISRRSSRTRTSRFSMRA